MKRILLAGITMLSSLITMAQTDSAAPAPTADTTVKGNSEDTVVVGNFVIIRNDKDRNTYNDSLPPRGEDYTIIIPGKKAYDDWRESSRKKNVSTNYLIFDLGFLNYNDKTDYSDPATAAFAEPGITKNDMKLITSKSSNVNIWLFMQKLNVYKHVVNLKYGLGLNMYNFRWNSNITFQDNIPSVRMDTLDFSKNKLYVGYASIPVMINITPNPERRRGFNFSVGVNTSYRVGTHSKQISDEYGKVKKRDDFGLSNWLFAYTGEIGIGPVRVYGSYNINTLFEEAKQYPYIIGLRFSNW